MQPQVIEPQRQSLLRSITFLLGIVVVLALTLLLFVAMMQPVLTEFAGRSQETLYSFLSYFSLNH